MLREAYRVLAPGRRFAVSDIVFQGHLPRALCLVYPPRGSSHGMRNEMQLAEEVAYQRG